ncbi:MAG: hypothetical protein Kow0059_12060 [Candidatus Sumerlaeia bacterium]
MGEDHPAGWSDPDSRLLVDPRFLTARSERGNFKRVCGIVHSYPPPSHPRLSTYAALIGLTLMLLVPPSVFRPIFVPDEGRYGEVSRVTLTEGRWIIPHLNGVPHLTKPFLYYDAVAAAMALFGQNGFALRVVSIVSFLITLIVSMRWVGARAGAQAERWTALILLSMLLPVGAAQFGDLNMMLTCFVTLGMLLMFDALESPGRLGAWYGGWVCLALAILTKGPVALLFPGAALVFYRLWGGRIQRPAVRHWVLGAGLMVLIALPWYVYVFSTIGRDLIQYWLNQMFFRTGLGSEKNFFLILYYVPVFLLGTSAWGGFWLWQVWRALEAEPGPSDRALWRRLPAAAWRRMRGLPAPERLLLGCTVGALAFFTLLRARMMSYILPGLPAFAAAVALWLARNVPAGAVSEGRIRRLAWAGAVVSHGGMWVFSVLMWAAVAWPEVLPMDLSEEVHTNIMGRMLAERRPAPGEQAVPLYQIRDFSPLMNFRYQRHSILVEAHVHREPFTMPPEYSDTLDHVFFGIQEGRPMLILVDSDHVRDLLPRGEHPNVRILFEGKSEILLSTLPRDLADPAARRRLTKSYD